MMTLGVVGLGRMGAPMASRLVTGGYRVAGFDVAGSANLAPPGVTPVASIAALAATSEVVLLSLPNGTIAHEVCNALTAPGSRARVVIELSTIGIAAASACAATLAAADIAYVDAPVSGGVAGAAGGTLTLMVACDSDRYRLVEPILRRFGSNLFHVGQRAGQGQAMKLLNNFISATALAATSEAAVFGVQAGLDLAQIIEVLNVSSGRTTASSDKFPRSVLTGRYDFGFAAALMTKDVQLYFESARAAAAPDGLAESVAALWRRFNMACPDADITALYRFLASEERAQ